MASVEIKITCGCGFKTESSKVKSGITTLEEAVKHCEKTTHTLTINGLVKGVKRGKA